MKLEVGKFYKDIKGRKCKCVLDDGTHPDEAYMVVREGMDHPIWHYQDGRANAVGYEYDLIAELPAEPAETPGPVRTVTRKEIVPGVYGGVEVAHVDYATEAHGANVCIRIDNGFGTDSLRAVIATLTEIADAMEDGE